MGNKRIKENKWRIWRIVSLNPYTMEFYSETFSSEKQMKQRLEEGDLYEDFTSCCVSGSTEGLDKQEEIAKRVIMKEFYGYI